MVYNRGSKGDWDRYAEVTGDSGLSWDNIQHYIAKVRLHSLTAFIDVLTLIRMKDSPLPQTNTTLRVSLIHRFIVLMVRMPSASLDLMATFLSRLSYLHLNNLKVLLVLFWTTIPDLLWGSVSSINFCLS